MPLHPQIPLLIPQINRVRDENVGNGERGARVRDDGKTNPTVCKPSGLLTIFVGLVFLKFFKIKEMNYGIFNFKNKSVGLTKPSNLFSKILS